jgi:hypothetical protein
MAKSVSMSVEKQSTAQLRRLDKPSLPCHTPYPFNTPTEGSMTLAGHLQELSEKHRTLESRIQEELARPGADDLQINRLKKEKLRIKEELTKLQGNGRAH